MPFLGNTPAESYISFAKQDITGNGGTSYSLNHPVTTAADIELFVNNVQQEPTEAYTASDSTLTLSEAIQSTDDCYCIFRGRSLGTFGPPDGSVTDAKITAMAASKLTGALPALDGSALTNVLPSLVAFHAKQVTALAANNYVIFSSIDTNEGSAYNSTDGKFTVPAGKGGTYFFHSRLQYDKQSSSDTDTNYNMLTFHKNDSQVGGSILSHYYGRGDYDYNDGSIVITLAAGDTMRVHSGGNATLYAGNYSLFNGFRIG